jgi:hypothetical protein
MSVLPVGPWAMASALTWKFSGADDGIRTATLTLAIS